VGIPLRVIADSEGKAVSVPQGFRSAAG
jgi:hypothetical protein